MYSIISKEEAKFFYLLKEDIYERVCFLSVSAYPDPEP
jgi:hypothetical protein